ncbi:MAG: methylated-DNA--[protein]-cysteine S-methyltransferase [Verrucomicrobiota bacterium]
MTKSLIETSEGIFTAWFSEGGLAKLDFPVFRGPQPPSTTPETRDWNPNAKPWVSAAREAIETTLAGKTPKLLPPFDLSSGTEFQREVWSALKKIPTGKTMTYGQLATLIGRPKAVRAVGQACGANPIPVLIPCHRVLAANGGLGGFSAGLVWKRKLLEKEQVTTSAHGRVGCGTK